MPSAQQERITVMSSTNAPVFSYQSETHMPDWPRCFQTRLGAIRVLFCVPWAVNLGLPMESGIGWPSIFSKAGL